MKFYFCETCGRRITDVDLDKGEGRDKKLKGVYCKGCADGVMTLEFSALNINELKKKPDRTPAKPEEPVDVAAHARRKTSVPHAPAARPRESNAMAAGAGIAAVLVVGVMIFVLTRPAAKPPERVTVEPAKPVVETPSDPTPARPVEAPKHDPKSPAPAEMKPPEQPPARPDEPVEPTTTSEPAKHPESAPEPSTPVSVPRDPEPAKGATTEPADAGKLAQPRIPEPAKVQPEPARPPEAVPAPVEAVGAAPIFSDEQRRMLAFFDGVFALLGKGEYESAIRTAQKCPAPEAQQLAVLLQKGQALQLLAISELTKNPPANPVRIKSGTTVINGVITRVDEKNAWIKEKGLEIPIKISELPPELLIDSLKLDSSTPERSMERAQCLFLLGNVNAAVALARQLDHTKFPDAALIALRGRLNDLRRFSEAVNAVEMAARAGDSSRAKTCIAALPRDYPELCVEFKQRIEELRALAEGSTFVNRIKKLFTGKVTRADPDLYVEILYKNELGEKCWADFSGDGWTVRLDGLNSRRYPPAEVLTHKARFQPRTLKLEFTPTGNNVIIGSLGYAHIKIRWVDAGQILFTYEPKFTGNVFVGDKWAHPIYTGNYRYAFERTPQQATFFLEGKEHFKKDMSKVALSPEDKTWAVGLYTNGENVMKEIVIKGHLDPEWLKQAREVEPAAKPK